MSVQTTWRCRCSLVIVVFFVVYVQVNAAFDYIMSRQSTGKVVLKMRDD